jgi:hypothetical protein
MFRHFKQLSITMADLRGKYGGQTGVWLAFSVPARDELGNTHQLGYYQGEFEDVLMAVATEHRRDFFDGPDWCGEIVPIVPKVVTGDGSRAGNDL